MLAPVLSVNCQNSEPCEVASGGFVSCVWAPARVSRRRPSRRTAAFASAASAQGRMSGSRRQCRHRLAAQGRDRRRQRLARPAHHIRRWQHQCQRRPDSPFDEAHIADRSPSSRVGRNSVGVTPHTAHRGRARVAEISSCPGTTRRRVHQPDDCLPAVEPPDARES